MDCISQFPIVFFSKTDCHYCVKLEDDLISLGIKDYKKVMVTEQNRDDLIATTNCKTVPQLFIGGKYIGGYTEFSRLCATQQIDTLLEPFGIKPTYDF